jgi:hypothetical protein
MRASAQGCDRETADLHTCASTARNARQCAGQRERRVVSSHAPELRASQREAAQVAAATTAHQLQRAPQSSKKLAAMSSCNAISGAMANAGTGSTGLRQRERAERVSTRCTHKLAERCARRGLLPLVHHELHDLLKHGRADFRELHLAERRLQKAAWARRVSSLKPCGRGSEAPHARTLRRQHVVNRLGHGRAALVHLERRRRKCAHQATLPTASRTGVSDAPRT